MNSLAVEHLSKCYRIGKRGAREIWALKDVSFEAQPGTILGIIGPNGAGKSTLLKILARVTPPTEGRVVGRGRLLSLLELGSAFHQDLSARENIFLNAAMYGIPRAEARRRLDDIVEFAEVSSHVEAPLRSFSSGMYLRLAFSLAINMEPDILLADEVLAVGDLAFQERCLRRVQESGRAGLTVLLVSHDLATVSRLCNRVMWLHGGQVLELGAPGEVVAHYESSVWTRLDSAPEQKDDTGLVEAHPSGGVLSTRLLSADGREIGAARASDEVALEVTLNLAKRNVGVRCAFDLYAKGVPVLRLTQPEPVQIPERGVYTASVRIPPRALGATRHTVNVTASFFHNGKWKRSIAHGALSFQVFDAEEPEADAAFGRLDRGVPRPQLTWSFERARDAIPT